MSTFTNRALPKLKRWLEKFDRPEQPADPQAPQFDNTYEWLDWSFRKLMRDEVCARRPQYLWGILQGAALAKIIDLKTVVVIEFGVASGAGLLCMERIAEQCEKLVGIRIDVFGFDTGTGYPKPRDYRDTPYRWFEGYYPCDKEALQQRLTRARMIYGPIAETLGEFMSRSHATIAFAGWDFNEYTGTSAGLQLYSADPTTLLPRTPCSFRSVVGKDNCEYTGEALAISEFNASSKERKICKIPGLNYFVAPKFSGHWIEMMRTLHIFNHPHYNRPQSYSLSAVVDINGAEIFADARFGSDLEAARASLRANSKNSQ